MIDLDKYVGWTKVSFNIHIGVSPAVTGVFPPEMDVSVKEISEKLQNELNMVVEKVLGQYEMEWSLSDRKIEVEPHMASGKILPREEREKLFREGWKGLQELFQKNEQERIRMLKEQEPCFGLYLVSGIRNDAHLYAESAWEAVQIAINSKFLHDWECPTAKLVKAGKFEPKDLQEPE